MIKEVQYKISPPQHTYHIYYRNGKIEEINARSVKTENDFIVFYQTIEQYSIKGDLLNKEQRPNFFVHQNELLKVITISGVEGQWSDFIKVIQNENIEVENQKNQQNIDNFNQPQSMDVNIHVDVEHIHKHESVVIQKSEEPVNDIYVVQKPTLADMVKIETPLSTINNDAHLSEHQISEETTAAKNINDSLEDFKEQNHIIDNEQPTHHEEKNIHEMEELSELEIPNDDVPSVTELNEQHSIDEMELPEIEELEVQNLEELEIPDEHMDNALLDSDDEWEAAAKAAELENDVLNEDNNKNELDDIAMPELKEEVNNISTSNHKTMNVEEELQELVGNLTANMFNGQEINPTASSIEREKIQEIANRDVSNNQQTSEYDTSMDKYQNEIIQKNIENYLNIINKNHRTVFNPYAYTQYLQQKFALPELHVDKVLSCLAMAIAHKKIDFNYLENMASQDLLNKFKNIHISNWQTHFDIYKYRDFINNSIPEFKQHKVNVIDVTIWLLKNGYIRLNEMA